MKTEINLIVQQLLKKDSLEQVTEQELADLITEYPYLSVGHLLLAKKKIDNGIHDQSVLQHTALYVNNPLWAQWVYNEDRFRFQKEIILTELPGSQLARTESLDKITEPEIPAPLFSNIDQRESQIVEEDPDNTEITGIDQTDSSPLQFQSYHTIDYFASQGIKLQQADLGKDKLGLQLRSFTEWLRSMKKLPETTGSAEEDASEQTVRVIAEHSIEEKEVLTEAMAEVWKKQGNLQRAREIYHKLSLLNPSKSAYFAAKIDQL